MAEAGTAKIVRLRSKHNKKYTKKKKLETEKNSTQSRSKCFYYVLPGLADRVLRGVNGVRLGVMGRGRDLIGCNIIIIKR